MWICRDGKSLTLILYASLLDKQLKTNNKKSPTGGSSSSTVLPVKDKSNSSCGVLLKTFLSLVDGDQKNLTSPDSGAVRGQSLVPAGDEGGDLEGGGGQDGDGQRHRDYWSDGPRHQQQVGRLVAVAAGEERQRNCGE